MKHGAKQWILVLLAAGVLAGASSKNPFTQALPKEARIQRAVARLTFGARPGDEEMVKRMGLEKWIDAQLHPERTPENAELVQRLDAFSVLKLDPSEVADDPMPAAAIRDLSQAKILRALYSDHQLEEQLVDFWFNHFNVNAAKGPERLFVAAYERDAIRPYVWGKFRDMLGAVAHSPAMLFYLDNWQSAAPEVTPSLEMLQSKAKAKGVDLQGKLDALQAQLKAVQAKAKGKQIRAINENYARELMELHTLGVDNGYTQDDIIEVAKCFTGWTILQPQQGGNAAFNILMHSRGEKTVLDTKINDGGERDGEHVLDILARRPETALFISRKLAQRFVADEPPQSLVDKMAKRFRDTDGDLREVVTVMVQAPEFFSEGARNAKVKTPLEFVASALRLSETEVRNPQPLIQQIANMGQPLYRKVEPTGYPTMGDEWLNSAALLSRLNFASDLAANKIQGVRAARVDATLAKTIGGPDFQKH